MRKGFTLIEVLVVAVIVAILAAVAIPAYNGYIQSSKEKVSRNTAGTIAAAAAAYYSENPTATTIAQAVAQSGTATFGTQSVKLPDSYQASITASAVWVQYKTETATRATVDWK